MYHLSSFVDLTCCGHHTQVQAPLHGQVTNEQAEQIRFQLHTVLNVSTRNSPDNEQWDLTSSMGHPLGVTSLPRARPFVSRLRTIAKSPALHAFAMSELSGTILRAWNVGYRLKPCNDMFSLTEYSLPKSDSCNPACQPAPFSLDAATKAEDLLALATPWDLRNGLVDMFVDCEGSETSRWTSVSCA
jgi:hypothetical protein